MARAYSQHPRLVLLSFFACAPRQAPSSLPLSAHACPLCCAHHPLPPLQKDKYDNSVTDYWGKFQVAQQELADAYSGNAEAGRVIGSA